MTFPTFQFAAMSSAVAGVAQVAIKTMDSIGEAFVDVLGTTSQDSAVGSESTERLSVPQQLSELAERFRSWLGGLGIEQPFEMRLQVDSLGYSQLEVSGEAGADIDRLLAEHPDWRKELERVAAQAQAQTQGLFSSGVEIKLDQTDSQLRRINSSELAAATNRSIG